MTSSTLCSYTYLHQIHPLVQRLMQPVSARTEGHKSFKCRVVKNLKRIYQKQFVINERNENLMSNEKMNESLPAVASKTFDLSKEFSTVAEGEGSMIRTSTTDDDVTLFNAINSSAEKLEEYIDQEVEVVAIVVTSADVAEDMNDEDSNKVNKPVVHFFCKHFLENKVISYSFIISPSYNVWSIFFCD